MGIYSIYKVTNKINGKVYIGFDSNWPRRMVEHKHSSIKKNYKFYLAIRKYGWNNFEWEVIYQSKDYEHCKNVMENYFIEMYDSYNNGYNSTKGGDGILGWNHTDEYKINKGHRFLVTEPSGKQVEIRNLRIYCQEHNLRTWRMSDVARGLYTQHRGYKCQALEPETVEKRNKIISNKIQKMNKICYIVYDPNGKEYKIHSLMDFCKEQSLHYSSMRRVSSGLRKHHKKWKVLKV